MNARQYFVTVRDIPYRFPLSADEADHTCYAKHVLLRNCLVTLGIWVRPRVCSFSWSDLVSLPAEIKQLSHRDDVGHTYLEVKINDNWIVLDAMWDKGLSKILPVNYWDGKTGTSIAVPTSKIYSVEESADVFDGNDDLDYYLNPGKEFYKALNEWLNNIRKEKTKNILF